MKRVMCVLLFIADVFLEQMFAVTILSNPTDEEFAQAYSTGLFSWSATFETAYPSNGTPEIKVITDHLENRDHTWSTPDQIAIDYDIAGNLNVRAGSTTLSVHPTTTFNMILIRVSDRTRFSTHTEFKDIAWGTLPLRNMFADDLGTFITDNDYQIIKEVGTTFALSGNFFRSLASVGNESQLEITGVWVVPEPSTFVMFFLATSFFYIRRR